MNGITHILKTASLAILLLFQFYFLYSGNFDYLLYHKDWDWISLLIIIVTIPANIFLIWVLLSYKNENRWLVAMIPISVIINGPFFGLWLEKHEKECFIKYGVKTWGIVTSTFYSHGPRMYYEFYIGDTCYKSSNVINPQIHENRDSIAIIYNSRCPEMNAAIENIDDL
jgi:hypothetical protein